MVDVKSSEHFNYVKNKYSPRLHFKMLEAEIVSDFSSQKATKVQKTESFAAPAQYPPMSSTT